MGCVELLLRELCCVDSLQAVLYRYFVGSVEVLFDSPGDERVPVPSFQSAYCLTLRRYVNVNKM